MLLKSNMALKMSDDNEYKGLDAFQFRSIKSKLKSMFEDIESIEHYNKPNNMYKTITCKIKVDKNLYIYSQLNYGEPDVNEVIERLERATKIQKSSYKLYAGYKPKIEEKKYLLFITMQVSGFCNTNYPGTIMAKREEREDFAWQLTKKYPNAKEALTQMDSEVRKKLNVVSIDDLF